MRTGSGPLLALLVVGISGCGSDDGGDGGADGRVSPLAPSALTFTASVGRGLPAGQEVVYTFPAGTANVIGGYPPGVPEATWLSVSDQGGTASTRTFRFAVNTTAPPAATRTTTVRFAALDGGGAVLGFGDVRVTYVLSAVASRLVVSDDGVALTSTPGPSRLTRSVAVLTSTGIAASWSAQSDQPWLTPTATGTTGTPLVLTADPTALATDTLYEATVTVTSNAQGIEGPATVRVGLWVGSTAPAPLTKLTLPYSSVVADPVRPYVYLSTGTHSIAVYHVHTATLVGTLSLPGATVHALAVSSDGTRLFAVDEPHHTVVPVDLATGSPGAPWSLPAGALFTRLVFARPSGLPLLLTSSGSIHDPMTGASYGTFPLPGSYPVIAASRNGSRVCVIGEGTSPYPLECFSLDGAAPPPVIGPVRSRTGGTSAGGSAAYAYAAALSADGTRAYVASQSLSEFTIYDAAATSLTVLGSRTGAVFPSSVTVGPDDRVYCGASNSGAVTTAWVYRADGTLDASFKLGNVTRRQLTPSGDALRIVALTGDGNVSSALSFVTVAP